MKTRGILGKRPHASRFVRIGQRLVNEALVTAEQLIEAVEAQRELGSRLGSVLVELGHLDADRLARCLGRWYGMPAALGEHFAQRNPSLQARLSPELAACHGAVPLSWLEGPQRRVAVAVMDPPSRQAVEQLQAALGHPFVPVIAADLLVRESLASIYGVAPTGRAAEPRMAPPLEHLEEDPECEMEIHLARASGPVALAHDDDAPEIDQEIEIDLDADIGEARAGESDDEDGEEITVRRKRLEEHAPMPPRRAAPARDDAIPIAYPEVDSSRRTNPIMTPALGRIPLRRVSSSPASADLGGVSSFVATQTLEDVVRAIRRATGRDRVGDLATGALRDHFEQIFEAGVILVVREPFLVGWKGFLRHGRHQAIESLAVPMQAASAVADACASRRPYVGAPAGGGSEMDHSMWRLLEVEPPRTVAVSPLLIGTPAACVVYAHAALPTTRVDEVIGDQFTALTGATAAALERLARAAAR